MKSIFTLTVVCLSQLLAAQQILTSSIINPQIGDEHIVNIDNVCFNTSDGPNQTWDLSFLNPGVIQTYTSFTPSLSTSYTMFPNANIATVNGSTISINSNNAEILFYNANDSALSYIGSYRPNYTVLGSGSIGYNSLNPQDVFRYPLTFNTQYSDTSNLYNFGTYTGSLILNYNSKTSYTVSYVGFGDIILPNGTYTNVAKVRTKEYSIKYYVNPVDSSYQEKLTENFYVNNNRFMPIASTQTVTSRFPNVSSTTYTILTSYYSNSILSNLSNSKSIKYKLDIFPNPVKNYLNIKSLFKQKIKSVQIENTEGQIIINEKNDSSLLSQRINVEYLKKGLYFIRVLFDDNSSATDKIIIE